jgi:hypothetical protein
MTKPKRKHTDQSLPGPDQRQAQLIAARVHAVLVGLCTDLPEANPESIAFEMYAASWRLTGGGK